MMANLCFLHLTKFHQKIVPRYLEIVNICFSRHFLLTQILLFKSTAYLATIACFCFSHFFSKASGYFYFSMCPAARAVYPSRGICWTAWGDLIIFSPHLTLSLSSGLWHGGYGAAVWDLAITCARCAWLENFVSFCPRHIFTWAWSLSFDTGNNDAHRCRPSRILLTFFMIFSPFSFFSYLHLNEVVEGKEQNLDIDVFKNSISNCYSSLWCLLRWPYLVMLEPVASFLVIKCFYLSQIFVNFSVNIYLAMSKDHDIFEDNFKIFLLFTGFLQKIDKIIKL